MRLWTADRPFDRDIWTAMGPGTGLVCGGDGLPPRRYVITARQWNWRKGESSMRFELEPA
jgi:hypothetical protein